MRSQVNARAHHSGHSSPWAAVRCRHLAMWRPSGQGAASGRGCARRSPNFLPPLVPSCYHAHLFSTNKTFITIPSTGATSKPLALPVSCDPTTSPASRIAHTRKARHAIETTLKMPLFDGPTGSLFAKFHPGIETSPSTRLACDRNLAQTQPSLAHAASPSNREAQIR